jgi:hypothetical protein
MILDEAIDMIRSAAQRQAVPRGKRRKRNLWDTVIAQIAERDSFDGECFDTFLDLIREFLAGLSDETVIELWCQTESGMGDDPEEQIAEFVRIELEDELLHEVTKTAWEEARRS